MKRLSLSVFCILTFLSLSANASMVFMRESENSKQIMFQANPAKEPVAITTGELAHLYPDISSDGKHIVYVEGTITDAGADLQLVIHNTLSKKNEILVTNVKGMILHPKFSKNGEMLFFSAPYNGKNTVYFANSTNKFLPEVLDVTEESYFPRPSSDGNFVVYQRNTNGKKEIIFFDRLANEKTVIAEGMSPSLSFDERLIAFTAKKNGNWNIYLYDRFLNTTKEITTESSDEMAPTFTSDNHIVFASNKTGHFQLMKLEDDGHISSVISAPGSDDYAPEFSGEIRFQQNTLANFPAPLRSSFGTLNYQGKIYMCGGHTGPEHTYPKESFTNNFNVYDKETNSWKTLAPRNFKAHGFQLAAYGNYIYAFGGFTFAEEYQPQWKSLDVIERYDIAANRWEVIGKLSRPRSSNVAITIGTKVYLVGGWDSTPTKPGDYEGTFHSVIDIFDLETEKASIAPFELQKPLRRAFTGLNYNGKILLVGGLGLGSSHFDLISSLTLIDPATGLSEELPPLPFATFAPAAEMIGNELYVFGGMFKTGEMNYEYVSHIYALNLKSLKWRHTGRFLKETKGFSQVFKIDERTLGILGGHHYFEDVDSPVNTFETFRR